MSTGTDFDNMLPRGEIGLHNDTRQNDRGFNKS